MGNRATFPEPHLLLQLLVGRPLLLLAHMLKRLPWFLLIGLRDTVYTSDTDWLHTAEIELTSVDRLKCFFLAASIDSIVSPILGVAIGIALKWLVVGRMVPGPRQDTEWEKFRYWFVEKLVPEKLLKSFAEVVGAHYKPMTYFYRLMGATVGDRIFWPGVPLNVKEYDLLHVGDDVTFGSRSMVYCADAQMAERIQICNGAMVADNCLLLPGVVLGENAILGTGSVANKEYDPNSISIGNINGGTIHLMSGSPSQESTRPFGRAVYNGDAHYHDLGDQCHLHNHLNTIQQGASLVCASGAPHAERL